MDPAREFSPQRLIYGCMGLGGSWDHAPYLAVDVDQAAAAIEAARSAGVTLFDHADIYRRGKSESVFGEVLATSPGLRGNILLQTKCGIRQAGNGLPGRYDFSAEHILEAVNGSLQRLRTGYVDTLLLHRPDPLMDVREAAAAVGQLMAEGKVRALGVSNMSGAQIAYLQDRLETPIVADQLEMSLGRRAWVESSVLVNRDDDGGAGFPTAHLNTRPPTGSNCRPTAPWRRDGIPAGQWIRWQSATPPGWLSRWRTRTQRPRRPLSWAGSCATRPGSPRSSAPPAWRGLAPAPARRTWPPR